MTSTFITPPTPEKSSGSTRKQPPAVSPQSNDKIIITNNFEETVKLIAFILTLCTLVAWGVDPINKAFRAFWTVTEKTSRYTQETFGNLGFTPKPGDKIAGYPVTSGYGKRTSPCAGCSSFHKGIDLGTPTGTQVYAPALPTQKVLVQCRQPESTGGGGLVAEVLIPDRGVLYQALHLSKCSGGTKKGGEIIALTGSSGVGTGAHLDLRKAPTNAQSFGEVAKPLNHVPITAFESWWFMTGSQPKPKQPKEMNQ